jgi:ribosomal protein S18 acetylase RimI-like enzyme
MDLLFEGTARRLQLRQLFRCPIRLIPMASADIRALAPDDAEAYSRLRLESLESDPEAFGTSDVEHRRLSIETIRARIAPDPENKFVIGAFVDGQLVGSVGLVRETNIKERHKARLWGVYVKANVRGQGLGRRLLTELLHRAARIEGVEQIVLAVAAPQAAAIALYRSLGFVSFGREPRALKLGGRYVDEEYMILRLFGTADPSSG